MRYEEMLELLSSAFYNDPLVYQFLQQYRLGTYFKDKEEMLCKLVAAMAERHKEITKNYENYIANNPRPFHMPT